MSEAHPAAALFPMMTGAEFDALKEDIHQHGLREPVVYYHGKLLDGRNRERACKDLGIQIEFVSLSRDEIGGCPYKYVASANLHRRHLTASQIALAAAALADRFAQEDISEKQGPSAAPPRRTEGKKSGSQKAASVLGVGQRTVEKAQRVLRDGAEPVAAAVRDGVVSVDTAEKLVKTEHNKKAQAAIVREAKKAADPDKAIKEQLDSSFDTAEIESDSASPAKPSKNGKPVVGQKLRKECQTAHGALCRALQKAGIYDEFIQTLSQIAERLKTI